MTDPVIRGRFISLEGVDGAGKSTHAAWLADALTARGHRVVRTREPGGTTLGEALRQLLLTQPMTHETEALEIAVVQVLGEEALRYARRNRPSVS